MEPRVLELTPDFPPAPGGIQLLAHRVATSLRRLRPTVIAPGGEGAAAFDAALSFTVRRSPATPDQRLTMALVNARALVEGLVRRPDVILSAHIVMAPAASALRRLSGVPVVLYVYADEVRARPGLAAFALRRSDAVVVVSRHTRELALRGGARPERVHVIHPGVDPAPPRRVERSSRPTVLTVARLTDRYKGHDVMLAAMVEVRRRLPEARWVVVGDGPLRPELEAEARRLGLDGAVEFTGSVPDAERDVWFERAHVFAMPSRLPEGGGGGEGFGIVFLEAGARGLPVVAGRVGGALDAVLDGTTGLLVEPTDVAVLATALGDLLEDPARAAALGDAGFEHASASTWAAHAERLEEVLLPLAAGARRRTQ